MHILTYGVYYAQQLGDGKAAGQIFDKVIAGIEAEGIKDYWLAAGTLLGIYRGEGFIPYDTDIDIELIGGNPDQFDAIARVCCDLGGREIRIVGDGEFVYQLAFLFAGNYIVDFFFYESLPDKLRSWSECSKGEISYPVDFLNHRTAVKFRGREFPCFDPEMYLKYLYGEEWKTPKDEKAVWKQL